MDFGPVILTAFIFFCLAAIVLGITLTKWPLFLVSILLSALWLWYGLDKARMYSGEDFYAMIAAVIILDLLFLIIAWLTRLITWAIHERRKQGERSTPPGA